jgi:tetratricopeptide (TPR) repeat protein
MSSEENTTVEELMEEGFSALRGGFYGEAARVGRELLERQHSSGFEILALALGEEDELEEALAVLEEGVEKAPDVWLLWQLMGNYRSDLEDFSGALEAYDHALFCDGVDKDSVYFNIATVLSRQEQFEEAVSYLELVQEADHRLRADAMRAELYRELNREVEAMELARLTLERVDERVTTLDEEEVDASHFSVICARLGLFFLDGEDALTAQACWERTWILDHTDEDALTLGRRLDPQTSPDAKYYHVVVEGNFGSDVEEPELQNLGFFVTYGIVAAPEDDVMTWVRFFEPEAVHDSLNLVECEPGDDCPDELLGVYSITGYATFSREDEDRMVEDEEDQND